MSRSGSYVSPDGATLEYSEQSGTVVGPLGGGRTTSASYTHYESADRGYTYSRYSSSASTIPPVGGYAVGGYAVGGYRVGGVGVARTTAVGVGPVGGVGVSRTAVGVGPFGGVGYRRSTTIVRP
jgi:hypothetical protein